MGWFSDEWKNFVGSVFGNDYLRDYAHAAKTFQTNGYQNAPKYKFLFHVYFDINQQTGINYIPEYSLLVKEIKLPSYKFDVKEYNQYNRKRLVQTAINYDPISITFHDDNANSINELWYAYYTYYYADALKVGSPLYNAGRGAVGNLRAGGFGRGDNNAEQEYRNIYDGNLPAGANDWGYIGETGVPSVPDPQKLPFFNSITIFGFEQHNFIAYTLINPIITEFAHDTYSYDESNTTMKNTMTIKYETVLYNKGYIDGTSPDEIATGFATREWYDRQLSPLLKPGTNAAVLGRGGLLDGLGGVFGNMGNDPIGSLIRGGLLYNSFKDVNIKDLLKREIEYDIITNSRQNPNPTRNTRFNFPVYGGQTPGYYAGAGNPTTAYTGLQPVDEEGQVVQTAGSQIPSGIAGPNSNQVGPITTRGPI